VRGDDPDRIADYLTLDRRLAVIEIIGAVPSTKITDDRIDAVEGWSRLRPPEAPAIVERTRQFARIAGVLQPL
jgi:hypothetical protein